MGDVITTSNLDQSTLLTFEKNFERIMQQKNSKLANSPAIRYMDIKGISNLSRIDGDELVDVSGQRNPDKQYTDIKNDNRRSVAFRFTRTYQVDSYDKAVNLVTDPTGDLFTNLSEAKNRCQDRVCVKAASSSVIVGAPNSEGTVLTPTQDGVITIDAKAGFSYKSTISPAITMFENNYVDCTNGITLAISSSEKQNLRDDEFYMNALYSGNNTVDKGNITNASGFNVVSFAGSVQGGKTVKNPVLAESEGYRTNLLLAPQSIAFASEVGRLDVERANSKVNSWDVTIDVWFKAVRTQGAKVILITSTI